MDRKFLRYNYGDYPLTLLLLLLLLLRVNFRAVKLYDRTKKIRSCTWKATCTTSLSADFSTHPEKEAHGSETQPRTTNVSMKTQTRTRVLTASLAIFKEGVVTIKRLKCPMHGVIITVFTMPRSVLWSRDNSLFVPGWRSKMVIYFFVMVGISTLFFFVSASFPCRAKLPQLYNPNPSSHPIPTVPLTLDSPSYI